MRKPVTRILAVLVIVSILAACITPRGVRRPPRPHPPPRPHSGMHIDLPAPFNHQQVR